MKKTKIAIVGAGQVGAQAAFLLGLNALGDIALIDIAKDMAKGKALDLAQAFTILNQDVNVVAGGYELLKDSSLVVVTAGLARQPQMSREDLLAKNKSIIEEVADAVAKLAPRAIVIVVTNPLDIMTYFFWQRSGFSHERVLGMGGLLDSGRLRYFLSQELNLPASMVQALVVGPHSDLMVALKSQASLSQAKTASQSLAAVFAKSALKAKNGGAEIVSLLKTGSAFFAPAAAVLQMAKAILNDEKKLFSLCCYANNAYGLGDVYLNLPAVLGKNGVEKVVTLNLSLAEKEALNKAAESVKSSLKKLQLYE